MPDRPNHAVRDGDFPVVYVATNKYLVKYFPHAKQGFIMLKLADGEQGRMVGYGALSTALGPVKGVYLIPTFDDRPSGVWRYDKTWIFKGGLPTANYTNVVASPKNPNHWIVWNRDHMPLSGGAQYTLNGGTTWQALTIDADHDEAGGGAWLWGESAFFEFSLDGTEVFLACDLFQGIPIDAPQLHPTVFRGTLADGIHEIGHNEYYNGGRGMAVAQPMPGDGHDVIYSMQVSYDTGLRQTASGYYANDDDWHEMWLSDASFGDQNLYYPERVTAPGSRAYYAIANGQFWYSGDYRTETPQPITSLIDPPISSFALLQGAVGYVTDTMGTLKLARMGTGTGSIQLELVPDVPSGALGGARADRQTHRIAAVRLGHTIDSYVFDGEQWALLPGPVGANASSTLGLAGTIEPLAVPEDAE